MLKNTALLALLLTGALLCPLASRAAPLSEAAEVIANHALQTYPEQLTASLASMVSFNTVADPDLPSDKNPVHIAFKGFLKEEAARLGFDYEDHGYLVVIGMGDSADRVGMITHGDVQPADPSKWARSPFILDAETEPGRLVARGAEDDKGPIATALYAMKAIKDSGLPLRKRLELYIYMAEESDWKPLERFLQGHLPPQVNITFDAVYPVVTAEKGSGTLTVTIPAATAAAGKDAQITDLSGGAFAGQVPEDASAVIGNASRALENEIRQRAARQKGVRYTYSWQGRELTVQARGRAAHSSKPEEGVNAIAMLADALKVRPWTGTPSANMVRFLNEMIGTGLYGERFGKTAYRDAFMGRMTVTPTVLRQKVGAVELNINVRRPRGKATDDLKAEFQQAFDQWKRLHAPHARLAMRIGEPWVMDYARHVPVLLDVFEHYTGQRNARPVAIGGSTNSRLFPNAVAFGPAMPGKAYTGHTEHEFITREQLLLNLQMYTAALVELAR